MLNKEYGDARDVLRALEMVVNDSNEIPEQEEIPIGKTIKDLSHDPYIQSIGSGLIVEALKELAGI